eukprot:Anaeramoba_ignava/c10525_g1_i1.p1 GENE.c10525_g1_i1~~c10525_g1_i1.p1  ORF type:complete len:115 (+),score=15.94 c10525_g1_i1:26-370(+)
MAFDIDNWLSTFSNEDVVFAFEGELSEEKLTEILDVVEQKLDSTDAPRKIKKKAYNIAIESIQNLFHHSDTVFLNGRQKKTLRYSVVLIIKVEKKGGVITKREETRRKRRPKTK